MPTSSTFNVIYLGQFASLDPTEGNARAENAGSLVNQTFDNLTNDSVQSFSPISYSSNDGGGTSSSNQTYNQNNNLGTDTFSITDADGAISSHGFDSVVLYNAVITYADGSTANIQVLIMQDTAGNAWIAPPSSFSPNAAALGAEPIQALRITGITQTPASGNLPGDTASGLFYNREVIEIVTVPCFAAGTLIRTPAGDVPVETLKTGDLVMTRDRGAQPIRWLGARSLDAADLQAAPHLRPIRIATGALGENLPAQDLLISPQHRVLVRSRIAQRMFDTDEVLIAAKSLVMLEGIDIDADADQVEYFHLMFDQHEIVFSNEAETESFYAGAEALKGIGEAAQDELFSLFPELRDAGMPEPARPMLSGRMGRKLTMRHAQNRKPLQLS